jgi:SAM-dependent methyltransferase
MPWELPEPAAARYESWYATPRGQRADRAERALLARLLGWFPRAQRVLESGCGTGHFTQWLASRGYAAVGLDRSPAMLREARRLAPGVPLVLADAHRLPLRDGAVDVSALVTTLEFLEQPTKALEESARVAGRGLVLLVLNRWSLGALSRRCGPQSRGSLLAGARDFSRALLRDALGRSAGERVLAIHWYSTLLPRPLDRIRPPLPFGDVLGVAVELAPSGRGGGSHGWNVAGRSGLAPLAGARRAERAR